MPALPRLHSWRNLLSILNSVTTAIRRSRLLTLWPDSEAACPLVAKSPKFRLFSPGGCITMGNGHVRTVRVSSPDSQRRGVAGLLVALTAVLPIDSLHAEELKLRCNPLSGSTSPIVLSIDMSRNSVHMGTDPDLGWGR